jgi:hypothetical protein
VINLIDASELYNVTIPEEKVILLDSSILLELCDFDHPNYQSRVRFFEQLIKNKNIQFRFLLATRLFVRDILRRRFLTDFLRSHIKRQVGYNSTTSAFDELVSRCILRCQADVSGLSLLSDSDLSHIREHCFRSFSTLEEGIRQWQFICQIALGKKLELASDRLSALNIRYVELKDLGIDGERSRKPQWKMQEQLMLQYGLNSSDTAIVSLIEAADRIFGILSNAHDLLELLQLRGHLKDLQCFTFSKPQIQRSAG